MTARTRKIRQTAKPRVGKYLVFGGIVITLALIAAFIVAGVNLAKSWLEDLPDWSDADAYILAEPTTILDADGNTIAELYLENRIPITIDQCSPWILEATVDVEDERFYSHNGVDVRGIMRAVVVQIAGGSEGASTITQQLVRNTVLKDEQFEKTLSRKVREAYIATELEKLYTKDEILMMYLNSIYYGEGCYGIEAAAQTYFGKACADLTLAEAATLAGLPQSPSAYDPVYYPENAVERRNAVLGRMLACESITQEQYDEAVASQLELHITKRRDSGAIAYPYFVNYVIGVLRQQFSTDTIFKGGLTVKTTITPSVQQSAEDAVWSVLGDADEALEAALVCIDPNNGHILAMVGGRDFNVDQFNLATQATRQPGSCFKTFTLTTAIQEGMNPSILDQRRLADDRRRLDPQQRLLRELRGPQLARGHLGLGQHRLRPGHPRAQDRPPEGGRHGQAHGHHLGAGRLRLPDPRHERRHRARHGLGLRHPRHRRRPLRRLLHHPGPRPPRQRLVPGGAHRRPGHLAGGRRRRDRRSPRRHQRRFHGLGFRGRPEREPARSRQDRYHRGA